MARSAAARLESGRQAYARGDFTKAYEDLSAEDARNPLPPEDLERLARSAGLLGRDEGYLTAFERAHHAYLQAGDPAGAARTAFWLGNRLLASGETSRASGWLSRGQRLIDEGNLDCVERGYYLLPLARRQIETRECEAARRTAAEAARIGERFRDADLVAFARNLEGKAFLREERIPEGLALIDEAMVAVTSGELSPLITGILYCSVIQSCHDFYAVGRAREWTAALKDWCETQQASATFTGYCLVHRSEILQWTGDWEGAIEEAQLASDRLAGDFSPSAAAPAHYQQAELHRLRGEFEAAEEAYASTSRSGREPQPGLALLRLAQGKVEAAASAMRRVVAAATDPFPRARLLPAHVEIMLAAGNIDEAGRAAAELQALARRIDIEVLEAMAAHSVGAVALARGEARAALEPLRRSFEIWQSLGAPYLAARVRMLVARACRQLGDEDGFELEAAAAKEVFEELKAAPDLQALETLGARPAPPARPHGLSPRELQVLRLVASGKTNKAIAVELFLSEKTVDRHVSNIFDKLDVPSRSAATAFAYEHRLI